MLVQILALALGQISQIADFPYQPTAYGPDGAAAFELAIVRFVKRHPNEERLFESSDGKCDVTVAVDEVKILDATTRQEKTVFVVTPFRGGNATPFRNNACVLRKFLPGKNYLLLTSYPSSGSLKFPQSHYLRQGTKIPEESRFAIITPCKQANEILGLAAFETKEARLHGKELVPIDRLMLNIANCLQGANLETVQQACMFLGYSQYGLFRNPGAKSAPTQIRFTKVPENAPFVSVMESTLATHNPSNAARIAIVLFNWKVLNSDTYLYQATKRAIYDPKLFCLPGDFFTVDFLGNEAIMGSATTESQRMLKIAELFDYAVAAKSPQVQWFLFSNCGFPLDNGRQRKALAIAASTNEALAELLLKRIAAWNDDAENVPKFEVIGSKRVFMNRKELIAYWQNVLGTLYK